MPRFLNFCVLSVKTWHPEACQSFQGDWSIFHRVESEDGSKKVLFTELDYG
jgi:hypothetical protein